MTAYRIVRQLERGEIILPVLGDGRRLSAEEIATLAERPDPARAEAVTIRRLRCVALDESPPRFPDEPGLRVTRRFHLRPHEPVVLLFGEDRRLDCGLVESLELMRPGATPGTVGAHMVAVGRIFDTRLGSAVWGAIQAGLLNAVCASLEDPEYDQGGRLSGGAVTELSLGPLERVTLPGAAILAAWEEPGDPLPLDLLVDEIETPNERRPA